MHSCFRFDAATLIEPGIRASQSKQDEDASPYAFRFRVSFVILLISQTFPLDGYERVAPMLFQRHRPVFWGCNHEEYEKVK